MLAALLNVLASTVAPATPTPSTQSIAGARVIAVAEAALCTQLGAACTRTTLRVIGRPDRILLPAGDLRLAADPVAGLLPRARVSVPVRLLVNGHDVQTADVWFAVSVFRTVETYAADAPRGTPATALTWRRASVDVAATAGTPFTEPPTLAGERLRRAVRAGQPVTPQDFEPIPDVDARQRVRVTVTYGAIHIDAVGTALAAGMKGATVPVVLAGAHASFQAQITGKGVVDLEH